MAVYRFKVYFEEDDEVVRTIEVKSIQTFKIFHEAIQAAIGFDNSKPATFYMSDDLWRKGREVQNLEKSKLANFIEDPHQKMLYFFDPEAGWALNIELVKIIVDEEVGAVYPRCIKKEGIAPPQYKKNNLPLVEEELDEEDDESEDARKEKIFQQEFGLDKEGDELMEDEEEGEGEFEEESPDEAESSDTE